MSRLLAFASLVWLGDNAKAQDSLRPQKLLAYKLKLLKESGETVRGYLKRISDGDVAYNIGFAHYGTAPAASDITVALSDIRAIKLRRKGTTGRAIAVGAGIGVAGGALAGLVDGDDPPGFLSFSAGEKAFALGMFFGLVGTAAGGIAGALTWQRHEIKGSPDALAAVRRMVEEKVYGVVSLPAQ